MIAAIDKYEGLACMVGNMVEMDVATAASEQFAASTRNVTYAYETGRPL